MPWLAGSLFVTILIRVRRAGFLFLSESDLGGGRDLLLSCSADRTIKIWDAWDRDLTKRCIQVLAACWLVVWSHLIRSHQSPAAAAVVDVGGSRWECALYGVVQRGDCLSIDRRHRSHLESGSSTHAASLSLVPSLPGRWEKICVDYAARTFYAD